MLLLAPVFLNSLNIIWLGIYVLELRLRFFLLLFLLFLLRFRLFFVFSINLIIFLLFLTFNFFYRVLTSLFLLFQVRIIILLLDDDSVENRFLFLLLSQVRPFGIRL